MDLFNIWNEKRRLCDMILYKQNYNSKRRNIQYVIGEKKIMNARSYLSVNTSVDTEVFLDAKGLVAVFASVGLLAGVRAEVAR